MNSDLKYAAWDKASPILGFDPAIYRRDDFGTAMRWSDYGNRNSDFGWEIDHVKPTALGGLDTAGNVRALNWKNNASLGGILGNVLNGKSH